MKMVDFTVEIIIMIILLAALLFFLVGSNVDVWNIFSGLIK